MTAKRERERPWHKLKVRYMAHEWETCVQMGRAFKIPKRTLEKHTPGWKEEREELDRAGDVEVRELALQANVQTKIDIYQQMKPMLEALMLKGINQLMRKVRDPKTGMMVDAPFASEATALGVARFGFAGLKLLERGDMASVPGALGQGGGIIIDQVLQSNPDNMSVQTRSYTADQLRATLSQLESEDGAQEGDHKGAAPKDRGARKRS